MIVTISGVDGCGKTTLGKQLATSLKCLGYDVIYRVEFNYFLLGYVKTFVNYIYPNKKRYEVFQKKILIEHACPSIVGSIWVYLTFFDLLFEYIYFQIFKRNKIIIMDRCIYDFLVGWQWIGYSNRFVKWLYLKFPSYNLSYILDIDPRVAYERKKKEQANDLHFFSTLKKMYLDLFAKNKKIHFLNGEDKLEASLIRISKEILNIKNGK